MAKTISIDEEAYQILKSHKVGNESFSEVIKKEMVLAAYEQTAEQLDRYFETIRKELRKKKPNGSSRRH
jgi:predicted CopG family antitoxin